MKDIKCNCEKLAESIDRLVLTEIICAFVTKSLSINRRLCEGKTECPITTILRYLGLSYEMNIPCTEKKPIENRIENIAINKQKTGIIKIKYSMGDGIPLLVPQPPPIGGKIETRSPS